jgi:hypothetical protein
VASLSVESKPPGQVTTSSRHSINLTQTSADNVSTIATSRNNPPNPVQYPYKTAMRSSPDLEIDLPRRDRHSPCPSRNPPPLQRRPQTHRFTLVLSQTNIQFEAFLPSDQRSVPYNMSSYTPTAPESPSFTSSLYSYFSLTPGTEDVGTWPGRFQFLAPLRAVYSFSLSPDDPWAQLVLQGNLVKLSPHKPGLFKAIVPCFERRDFVRLKKVKLNDLAQSGEGEMIWVKRRRRRWECGLELWSGR